MKTPNIICSAKDLTDEEIVRVVEGWPAEYESRHTDPLEGQLNLLAQKGRNITFSEKLFDDIRKRYQFLTNNVLVA